MTEQPSDDPDQISLSPEEICQIGEAFNFLYHGIKKAQQRFEDTKSQDDGRDGAIHALEYVLKFFDCLGTTGIYPFIVVDGVHAPLARLCDDLMSLNDGKVSAMLRPTKKEKGGRAKASGFYDGLKGNAVFTVGRLIATTGMSLSEARRAVAGELARRGVRPTRKGSPESGQVSERTIRKWQEDIAADIGFHTDAAQTLEQMAIVPLSVV